MMGLVHVRAAPRVVFGVVHGWSELLGLLLYLHRRRSRMLNRCIFRRRLRRLRRKFSNWRQDGLCSKAGKLGLWEVCDEMSY
jgi:hypothetical protein